MDRHTIIFTMDKRASDLGTLLPGRRVQCSWEEYRRKKQGDDNVRKVYVFPTPVCKLDNYRNIQRNLRDEFVSEPPGCVFGGMFSQEWNNFLTEHQISYVDFMELEEVVAANAQITAEAVIAEVLQLSSYSIKGQKIVVTGFGACARPIAGKLKVLGAEIMIVARDEKARKRARECGYGVCDFDNWGRNASEATTVINTVPSLVITKEIIEKMSKETVILDIASKPGGTDFDCAKELGITAKLALGLPGIYSTKSSAFAYKSAMWEYAPLPELKRGEQSWIFQIII